MSFTRKHTVNQGAYLLVASGEGDAFVQLQDEGPVDVWFGTVDPNGLDPVPDGVLLDDGHGLMEMSFTGMVAADRVYARSRLDEDNEIVVLGSGTDPQA
jgi:hypothetical protein